MTGTTTLVAGLLVVTLSGCGGGESNIIVAPAETERRFSTADELVEYYNELMTTSPSDPRGLGELFYAENERQREDIALYEPMMDMLDLHEALYRRFGEGYFPDAESVFDPEPPAVITERGPQRAIATSTSDTGDIETIQLVHADDRWWLSGEMLAQIRIGLSEDEIHGRSLVIGGIGKAGREMVPMIREGRFSSLDDAKEALWLRAIQIEPGLMRYMQGGGG